MAIKHLANISLEGNEIQNVLIHKLAVEPSGVEGQVYFNTATNLLKVHNGTDWISVMGDVESVATGNASTITIGGTALNPTVSANTAAVSNGSANLVTGDAVFDHVATAISSIPAGSNTTYDISVTDGSNQASIDLNAGGSGSGTDSVNIKGTTSEITVEGSGSDITIGLPDNVVIAGNLTVNGTTTSINTNEVSIGDNIIVLNSDEAGTPSQDGGIEIERGTSANSKLFWDESTDKWTVSDGTTETAIPLTTVTNNNQITNGEGYITGVDFDEIGGTQSDLSLSGFNNNMVVSDFTNDAGYITSASLISARTDEEIRDLAAGQWINGTNSTVVYNDASNTIKVNTVNTTYSNVSEFTNDSNYLVEADLKRNSFLIGNGSLTTITQAHGLGSANLIVQLVEVSTGAQVFAETSMNATNIIVTFATAPTSNQYRINAFKVS